MSSQRGLRLVVTALVTAGFVVACSGPEHSPRDPDPSTAAADRVPLTGDGLVAIEGETWKLTEATIDGDTKTLPGRPLSASFAEAENAMHLFGTACNNMGATVEGWPRSISVSDASWTEMACDDATLNEAEVWFFDSLQRVTSVAMDGNQLIMWGDGVDLVYDPMPSP